MSKLLNAWVLPLLSISTNGVLTWLVNQLPEKPDYVSQKLIISLTIICMIVQFFLTLCGGTKQYNEKVWIAFCSRVGWRFGGKWLVLNDYTFDINAPEGHLPILYHGRAKGYMRAFLSRTDL
jgi:hypothetical protein